MVSSVITFITADHGMNHKSRALDLEKALQNRDIRINTVISPLVDEQPKHYSGYGGIFYVYRNHPADEKKVKAALPLFHFYHRFSDVVFRLPSGGEVFFRLFKLHLVGDICCGVNQPIFNCFNNMLKVLPCRVSAAHQGCLTQFSQ